MLNFILGIIVTLGLELFVILSLLVVFGGDKCKGKCISCKFYSVGTDTCIRDIIDNRLKQLPEPPQNYSCENYESVV